MPLNCPQAVFKLKAYQKTHQDLQQQFSDFMSQFPYLPDIKTDEPFMQSPHYQILTDSPKEVFHNLYDAKQEARKKLAELKEITNYEEKKFLKLTFEQQLEHLYSRCFESAKYFKQKKPIPDLTRYELRVLYDNCKYYTLLKQIIHNRNQAADMLKIFDCTRDQIIYSKTELQQALKDRKPIKAYIGELFPNFFQILPQDIEYIYTEFPEDKVEQKTIKLGTGLKTKEDFIKAIEQQQGEVNDRAKEIMDNPEFSVSEEEYNENLIILSVEMLRAHNNGTIGNIFDKARELGLELCPAEIGPQYRIQYLKREVRSFLIGMNPIFDQIFDVFSGVGGKPCLDVSGGHFDSKYNDNDLFAFVRASNS